MRHRLAILCAASAMIFIAGVSRIHPGVHCPSDVLAPIAEGIAWLALWLSAAATLQRWVGRRRAGDLPARGG